MKNSKQTKRKFYNKWLYKITLTIPGIAYCRDRKISNVILNSKFYQNLDIHNLRKLDNELSSVDKLEWGQRIECNNIDIYTNNKEFFLQLSKNFANITVHRFEPISDRLLLEKNNVYIVNDYPYGKFQYKVFLNPLKIGDDLNRRTSFLSWLDSQGDRILISDSVKHWFVNNYWNWDRRYLYVKDEQTLLMMKIRDHDAVGRSYKYLLADK